MDLKLEQFEGPLDLLLHLIKENKMDIFDIEVNQITEQYLAYIHSLQDASLEVASSYLVMASELLELKARMLLPHEKMEKEEEEEDPRTDLVERLLEYQAYQEITKQLKEKEEERKQIHTKLPEKIQDYVEEDTSLPLERMLGATSAAGVPSSVSFDAGTYVCNNLFYKLMYEIKYSDLCRFGGFIHFPRASVCSPERLAGAVCAAVSDAFS